MRAVIRSMGLAGATWFAFVSVTGVARADAAGDKVLTSLDAALNKAKTLYVSYEVTNAEPGKPEKKLAFEVRRKGDKVMQEFVAPADMKGTKLLVLSWDQIYVYLPAFGKIRRLANGLADQGFMGLAFTVNDLHRARYGDQYTATVASETPKEWKLVLTPKTGQKPDYTKIEMTVAKDRVVPTELKYFDAASVNTKTETRSGYTCEGDVCTPGERKMVNNTKPGWWTKLVAVKRKVNEAINDTFFSKKSLGE